MVSRILHRVEPLNITIMMIPKCVFIHEPELHNFFVQYLHCIKI